MPLIRDILSHWSATHIVREGTGWEHRVRTLEDSLSGSLTKLLAEDQSPTCGLVNYLVVATHQTSPGQASHERETKGEKERFREQQTPSTA